MKKTIILTNFITLLIILAIGFLINYRFSELPKQIPFFYTAPWGHQQLANKVFIFGLPIIAIIFQIINLFLSIRANKNNQPIIAKLYGYTSIFVSFLVSILTIRILNISTHSFPFIPIEFKLTFVPIIVAFISTLIIIPFIIKLSKRLGLVDDPLLHKHPAMLITKPTPRMGGLAFLIGLGVSSVFLIPILGNQKLIGILIGVVICVILGIIDTKKDPNPLFRLGVQGLAVLIVALSGIIMVYLPNPFGIPINLDHFRFTFELFGTHTVYYISVLAAMIWMGLVMNFMSWSNGSDGVYAGLVSFSSLAIAILMIGSLNQDPQLAIYIKLASIVVGAGFAMAIYTWPPQKLLWGFGATAPALIIGALSILGSTKISTTILILMIPFLDGAFAIIRRLRRKQFPFWGDREHFHHKLKDIGWSKQKIAIFYWTSTIILFIFAIITSGKTKLIYFISFGLLFALTVSILNFIKIRALHHNKKHHN